MFDALADFRWSCNFCYFLVMFGISAMLRYSVFCDLVEFLHSEIMRQMLDHGRNSGELLPSLQNFLTSILQL